MVKVQREGRKKRWTRQREGERGGVEQPITEGQYYRPSAPLFQEYSAIQKSFFFLPFHSESRGALVLVPKAHKNIYTVAEGAYLADRQTWNLPVRYVFCVLPSVFFIHSYPLLGRIKALFSSGEKKWSAAGNSSNCFCGRGLFN